MAGSASSKAYLSGLWVAVIIFLYLTLLTDDNVKSSQSTSLQKNGFKMKGATSSSDVIDAVVYIVMGSAARRQIVEYSIASLRNIGGWDKTVYLLTDKTSCFDKLISESNVRLIHVPEVSTVMEIKNIKANIYKYLPQEINSALYLDVDIVVADNIQHFLNEISAQVGNSKEMDMAAFFDAKGHFVGWCDGCEKWHTGVLLLFRGKGQKCMEAWSSTILSKKYDTDQESLDEAELSGACSKIVPFA